MNGACVIHSGPHRDASGRAVTGTATMREVVAAADLSRGAVFRASVLKVVGAPEDAARSV